MSHYIAFALSPHRGVPKWSTGVSGKMGHIASFSLLYMSSCPSAAQELCLTNNCVSANWNAGQGQWQGPHGLLRTILRAEAHLCSNPNWRLVTVVKNGLVCSLTRKHNRSPSPHARNQRMLSHRRLRWF